MVTTNYNGVKYWDIKCSLRLDLNELRDGAVFTKTGNKFQYFGPLDANVLIRHNF